MVREICFFANTGYLDQTPKSGGQSSARRVARGIEDMGFHVHIIRRHRAEMEKRFAHKAEVLFFAFVDLIKIVVFLLPKNRKHYAFMHLSYAGSLVPYEYILSLVTRFLGFKCLLYIKGGQVLDCYTNGTKLHKWLYRQTLNLQEIVFFEGIESMDMARTLTTRPLCFFPNYVSEDQIPEQVGRRDEQIVNICYFGRIAPDKNVHVVVKSFELLCEMGINAHLTIIGGAGQRKNYVSQVDAMIKNSIYSDKISRYGLSPFSFIRQILQLQHFFIFPTKEKCEGHSNSLTESMSQGVIPIVSDYHFNRSVVGNELLVVKGYDPQLYADRIRKILNSCDLYALSKELHLRVKENFAYRVVTNRVYESLCSL